MSILPAILDPYATGNHDTYCACGNNLDNTDTHTTPCPYTPNTQACTSCCTCEDCAGNQNSAMHTPGTGAW